MKRHLNLCGSRAARRAARLSTLAGVVSALTLAAASAGAAGQAGYVRHVDTIESASPDATSNGALVFSPEANRFLVISSGASARAEIASSTRWSEASIPVPIENALNVALDPERRRLLILNAADGELIEVGLDPNGLPDASRLRRTPIAHLGLRAPRGISIDASRGELYILDGGQVLRVASDVSGSFAASNPAGVAIQGIGTADLQGVAYHAASGSVHVLNTSEKRIYEIAASGTVVQSYELDGLVSGQPACLISAPSGDATDAPETMNLFVGSSPTGDVMELSLSAPVQMAANNTGTLVQTIDTSAFVPPSPDPAGIAYLAANDTLLTSDSEVNEMAIFQGVNLFELLRTGGLVETGVTTGFSNEPTGVAYDTITGHVYITDDDANALFEVDPAGDGLYGTADDIVTTIDTLAFGAGDVEGIAYDSFSGALFIVDGVNSEVYRLSPGPNGVFDGVAPAGDDTVSQFDTTAVGVTDPEGITFDTNNGHLYLIGTPIDTIVEIMTDGTFLRAIDIAAAAPVNPAGLAFAPSSLDPLLDNLYVTDRGIDNNSDPNENDGKIYEIAFSPITPGNTLPQVSAGADAMLMLPGGLALDGTVTDDGIPGALATTWSQISGEGTVTFSNAAAVDTTAFFSIAGTYVLRLSASDGELSGADEVTITVTGSAGESVLDVRIDASSDDAEEKSGTNQGNITSPDLELVLDGVDQTIGLRFNGLSLPPGAVITNAFVQFQVDETDSEPTSLNIQGEASDNPVTFVPFKNAITSRPRTAASVSWSPVPWDNVGDQLAAQRTPNIASVVQEIVDRPGWASGNSLVIIIDGTGKRVAEAFDGVPAGAPLLHVEYLAPGTGVGSFEAHFDTDSESFAYVDDAFRSTSAPDYASGAYDPAGGFDGGGLGVALGGIDDADIDDMSGGWRRSFTLGSARSVSLSFRFNLTQASNYESNELSQALASIDGSLIGVDGNDYVAQIVGNGNGGPPQSTGWVQVTLDAGDLAAGTHTVTIGAFNNRKTFNDETTTIQIDDVVLTVTDPGNTAPSVSIASPPSGTIVTAGVPVLFSGTANDAQEGDLSASLSWSSDIDGALGVGSLLSAALSVGTHRITASVADVGGLIGADVIFVRSVPPNTPPTVSISSPASGSSFGQGEGVVFEASALDAEDGDLTSALAWVSDRDGPIGTGGALLSSSLSVGAHVVTASVTDSGGLPGADSVSLTITPSFTATFDSGPDGFSYVDDAFRGTSQPSYASGAFSPVGGFSGGGLSTTLGGIDNDDIDDMSGGWRRAFTLGQTQSVTVSLRYNLTQAANYESNELSQALLSIDQTLFGIGGNDYLAQIVGNGNGGNPQSTGWVQVSLAAGNLPAGIHTITIGSYNNRKTYADEQTDFLIDDVVVTIGPPVNVPPAVAISAPADLSVFVEGDTVSFAGTANDEVDGDLTAALSWASSRDGVIGSGGGFSTSSLSLGVHVITASATDSGGLTGEAAIKIAVTGPAGLALLDQRVAQGTDDAEERASGDMYLDSSDLELVTDGAPQKVGIRFSGLNIPAGSSVFRAWVQFQIDEADSGNTALTIRGQASDDAGTFLDVDGDISGRANTGASVAWAPPPWTNVGEQGPSQRTPDLTEVLQEIVGRPGWQNGNALALLITGIGERTAEAYDGVAGAAASLHVEFVVDPSVVPPVTVVAEATRDAYTEEDSSDHNHSSNSTLKVKPDANKRRHSLVGFDLAAVPAGSEVLSATLMLWEENDKDNQLIHIHRLNADWIESEVTWDDRDDGSAWTTPGGDFDPTPVGSFAPTIEKQYRNVDVTAVVKDWISGAEGNFGFLVRSTGANGEVKFKSREEGKANKRPRLSITYKP